MVSLQLIVLYTTQHTHIAKYEQYTVQHAKHNGYNSIIKAMFILMYVIVKIDFSLDFLP